MRSSACDVSGSVTMTTSDLKRTIALKRSCHIEIVCEIVLSTQQRDTGKSSKHLLFGHSIDNADIYFPYLEPITTKAKV